MDFFSDIIAVARREKKSSIPAFGSLSCVGSSLMLTATEFFTTMSSYCMPQLLRSRSSFEKKPRFGTLEPKDAPKSPDCVRLYWLNPAIVDYIFPPIFLSVFAVFSRLLFVSMALRISSCSVFVISA